MKRWICLLLIFTMCLSLCACGGTPVKDSAAATEQPTAVPATEPPTEPVTYIIVTVKVPEEWQNPAYWAWKDGGSDVFAVWPGESMVPAGNGEYTVSVPGWADRVIINANGGAVQTADLTVEPEKDLWIHVVNQDYAFVHYGVPSDEELETELEQPALDYHESVHNTLFRGGYQIRGTKFVTYNANRKMQYSTDYIPTELQAEDPAEIYYVIRLESADKHVGYYVGASMKSAVKPGVRVKIVEAATEKIVMQSDPFMGGDPPETINYTDSGRGKEPDEAEIRAWIQSAIEEISKNPPTQMPKVSLNEEALTEEEKAILEAKDFVDRLCFSYNGLIEWLVEYEDYTQETAKYAADNCGADWQEVALRAAKEMLSEQPDNYKGYYSREGMRYYLSEIKDFTKEEAAYAADNCGADWMEQARLQAQHTVDDEEGMGYSERGLSLYLRSKADQGGCGFTTEEAAYAMEHIKVDWKQEAVKRAAFILEYGSTSYSKAQMVYDLVNYEWFTDEEAAYGAEKNGLK